MNRSVTPEGSKNQRYYCKSCDDYIGENALRPLGMFAFPLHRAVGDVPDCYKPNHHIFYEFRAANVADSLPKWNTLPEGRLVQPTDPSPPTLSDASHFKPAPTFSTGAQWDNDRGWYRKDVQPLSPTRTPESKVYHFTENDPAPNHVSLITPDKVQERVNKKYYPSPQKFVAPNRTKRDVIIIGGVSKLTS
jgi:hypothetical protein